jgi:hypothetical protein
MTIILSGLSLCLVILALEVFDNEIVVLVCMAGSFLAERTPNDEYCATSRKLLLHSFTLFIEYTSCPRCTHVRADRFAYTIIQLTALQRVCEQCEL